MYLAFEAPLLTPAWLQNVEDISEVYVRPDGEKAVEKQASFDSARLNLSAAISCHSYLA